MNDEDDDPPHLLLACGHIWDGDEPWPEMAVILKETIDGPEGPLPAYSTGHYCRTCRATLEGERLSSVAEADNWLRQALVSQ